MKKIYSYLLLGLAVCVLALTSFARVSPIDLAKDLVGEWRNVYVKIIVHHQGSPNITMEADSTNWDSRMRIKPIRTHFKEDGTFYSEYFNLKDSLVRKTSGNWTVNDDLLTMTQILPEKSVLKLHVKISVDHAIFIGVIDFDGEGIENDEYFGIQRKFSK